MDIPQKILLLEDNPSDAQILLRLLKKTGLVFECRITINKQEYLAGLNEFVPDIIISDNTLIGFDATEALEIYHRLSLTIPFILVTGTVSEEFAAEIIKLGADDYILKDRLTRLPSAMEHALKKRKIEKEKKEAIEKLRFSEKNLSTIFENATEGFLLTDTDYVVKAFNENAKKFLSYQSSHTLEAGEKLFSFFEPSGTEPVLKMMGKALMGEKSQLDRKYEMSNKTIWLNYSINPVQENGSISGTCISIRDISDLKIAEQRQLSEQKKISRAIIKAQETERNHLGQELHDNINQLLAAIRIHLDKARKNHEILEDPLAYPIELLNMTMEEIRSLSKNLVTPFNTNLKDQLESLLDSLQTNVGIQTSLEYDVKHIIDDDQKLHIYRIFQEQVNNIIKHSEAKQVSVQIKSDDKQIAIVITDDGKGFDDKMKNKGIGLPNIINRVELFFGKVIIITAPGKGCIIQITMPIQND